MSDTPMDCEHGQLARACRICELERELAAERERADRNQEDAERLCSLLDATEVNGDRFTWKRRALLPTEALRDEIDAIFGLDAARRK